MSDGPFLCYKELVASSNVELSQFFHSFNAIIGVSEEFLLVATASTIEIHKVLKIGDDIRLSKCIHLKLFGRPQDVACFHDSADTKRDDLLLLSLDCGKFILVSYDSGKNNLRTHWMCNAEENASGFGSEVQLSALSKKVPVGAPLRVVSSHLDSLGCCVLNGQHLLFVDVSPFGKAANISKSDIGTVSSPNNHFFVDVNALLNLDGAIIDCCFVTGYSRPVVAVLQEKLLPIGHCAKNMNTCVLTILAVDTTSKSVAVLWSQANLPHDCIALVSTSHETLISCITVISMNAVLLVSQQSVVGLAVNGFAGTTVSPHIDLQPWLGQEEGYELDGSRWLEDTSGTANFTVVGTLKSGLIVKVSAAIPSGEHARLTSAVFFAEVVAKSIRCSTFSASNSFDLWFLGSRQVDSLLLQVSTQDFDSFAAGEDDEEDVIVKADVLPPRKSMSVDDLVPLSPNSKRQRRFTNSFMDEESYQTNGGGGVGTDVHSEEIYLYGDVIDIEHEASTAVIDVTKASSTYLLTPVDSIRSLGPVLNGSFCKPEAQFNRLDSIDWVRGSLPSFTNSTNTKSSSTAGSYIADRELKDCLQLSAGLGEQAALCRVYSGLSLSKVSVRNFVGATRVFTLADDKYRRSGYCTLLVGYENKTRVFHCVDGGTGDAPELKMKEIVGSESGFHTSDCLTVGVGLIHELNTLSGIERTGVQICSNGLRLVKLGSRVGENGTALQDVLLTDSVEIGGLGGASDEVIVSGEVTIGWVCLLTNKANLFILCHDVDNECLELKYTRMAESTNGVHIVESGDETVSKELKNGHSNGHTVSHTPVLSDLIHNTVTSTTFHYGVINFAKSLTNKTHAAQSVVIESDSVKSLSELKKSEEKLLYDEELTDSSNTTGELINEVPMTLDSDEEDAGFESTVPFVDGEEPLAFIAIVDVGGRLTILRLTDLLVVFSHDNILQCEDTIVNVSEVKPATHKDSGDRFVVESMLARIGVKQDPVELHKLVLLLYFNSGDIVTYAANESNGIVCSFSKIDHRCVNNKRNHKTKASIGTELSGTVEVLQHLSSVEQQRVGDLFCYFSELNGSSGVLISGNQPMVLLGGHGIPSMIPIGFPEIPFINYGHNCVVPVKVGGIKAIVSLWFEFEDLEAIRNPSSAAGLTSSRQHKLASLGIYQEVKDLDVFSNSSVSVKKVTIGKTTHQCTEILKRTDDKTEQALLEKRTFVLTCSEEVKRPFIPNVLTPEETEEEDVLYERYMTSLDSFSQPNLDLGLAPNLVERSYQLTLVQGGVAVDTYVMPSTERILDMAVLYLTFEKLATGIITFGMPIMTRESRVFVAASTSIADRRGEDTQGSGRLLLFALDFALFQDTVSHLEEVGVVKDSTAATATSEEHNVESTATTTSSMDVVGDAHTSTSSVSGSSVAASGTAAAAPAASSVQAKFLGAIQPKLKLVWSGPGPASVVKQMGEFVISTVGATLFVYRMNPTTLELDQVAFHFAQFYVTSVTIVKNYIVLADLMHSVQLLFWRPEDCSLTVISKDFDQSTFLTTACVHDGSKLGIVVGDDEGNIQIMQQNPKKLESVRGTRLMTLADFHVGSDVSVLLGHDLLTADIVKKLPHNPLDNRPPPPPPRTRKGSSFPLQSFGTRFGKANSTRSAAIIGTMDGGLGMLIPVEEKMYRRLLLLQQIMSITLQSPLSLNPKEYRLLKTTRFKYNKMKGVLDGTLLWTFNSLHPKLQEELAAAVGATAYTIKENLHDVEYLSSFI